MKYGTWNIELPRASAVAALCAAGYSPLTARVLSARGITDAARAAQLLSTEEPLADPFLLKEMERAVAVIRAAVEQGRRIAVFGDYDVDGITATCLLMDYLRSIGADCVAHIPGRLEEGYGLNAAAIRELALAGVELIVTVDCGITALEEAELCAAMGITLVVTDHHECKAALPRAAAVIDPHRPDRTYPHTGLSGVGIAFKLAAALDGDQQAIARRYCDFFCLGTIADVMPLCGENRHLVMMGLKALRNPSRVGIRALLEASGCLTQRITASTVGFVLAPRINAAGRMEHAELAVELFLTEDAQRAAELAETLCSLNRERQETESVIYREAVAQLRRSKRSESAIVLAGENWHQGVVGIVASRLSEEFCRPAFLISLTGEHGKASSRSYGGFNLFASLSELSDLLEGYGGHELAAGFTIRRENIDEFRRSICRSAERFAASGAAGASLRIDCEVAPKLLTLENAEGLEELEPCGTGCPKPVFCLSQVQVERLSTVGGGKHLRLRLRAGDGAVFQAIYFSAGPLAKKLFTGERLDIAFHLQVNEYRGTRSVQLSLIDLRRVVPNGLYDRFRARETLSAFEVAKLAPERADIADVWNYLRYTAPAGRTLRCSMEDFCFGVAAFSNERHCVCRTAACLDILNELKLIVLHRSGSTVEICLIDGVQNPLENSSLYRALRELKGEE